MEAPNNIAAHAYCHRKGLPVDLMWWSEDQRLGSEIRGQGLPFIVVLEGELPEAESGRGYYMFRAPADTLNCRREFKENVLLLTSSSAARDV